MAWTIEIGEGASKVTIASDASFQISTSQSTKPDGSIEFVDTDVVIVGDVIQSTPAAVANTVVTLRALAEAENPVRVQIFQDAVSKWDFKPAEFLGSPKVVEFQTLPDDGAGESHWPFQLRIRMRQGSETVSVGGGGVVQTVRQTVVEKYGSAYVRKLWRISAVGKTIEEAKNFVFARKPVARPLREVISVDGHTTGVTAEWVWEAARGSVIEFIEAQPVFREGGPRFVIDRQTNNADPVAHLGRRDPHQVTFSGIIRAVGRPGGLPPTIDPPKPHLQPGGGIVKIGDSGNTLGPPVLVDPKQGIYELAWSESYLVLRDIRPIPDHSGHDAAFALQEPPDGNFFG